tara:strand:+ start:2141 stop:2509 length:369 start_codon:yes stop_codon:yes gene_type:complete
MKKILLYIIIFNFLLTFQNLSLATNISDKINKISKNLRCLICQGQSVYDSQSDFADSIKYLIEKKLNDGKSEKEIYTYLKEKYGEWIIYEPEINKKTYLLWSIPLILFVFGGLLIFRKANIS